MSSAGKLPPAPALGCSTSVRSNATESHSWPLLLVPAKPGSWFSAFSVSLCLASTTMLVCCKNPACSQQLGGSPVVLAQAQHTRLAHGRQAQPNVHQGVSLVSQSSKILRTVQGAPATLRAVRDSIWYLTLFRPPSRSTLNCS